MDNLRTAAQAALSVLDEIGQADVYPEQWQKVEDLRAALAQPEQQAAPAVFLPDCAELSDAWAALLDAGESPICEDDTVANAIRRLTGRSLTLTVSTADTFHGNYRIADGGRSRGVTIARSDLADDMSDSDLRGLLSEACDDAAHQSIRVEPLDVEVFLKWARNGGYGIIVGIFPPQNTDNIPSSS